MLVLKGNSPNSGNKIYALLYEGEVIVEGGAIDLHKEVNGIVSKSFRSTLNNVLEERGSLKRIDDAIEKLSINNIPKNTLSALQAQRRLNKIISKLKRSSKKFDPNKQALKKLKIKLPKSKTGLSVDFEGSPYLYPAKGNEKAIVKIKLTFNDIHDKLLANKLAGFSRNPAGYTWHHLDDYDPLNGTCTMQLVETKIHQATVPHYGGVKIAEEFFKITYKTRK